MTFRTTTVALISTALLAAGCGGSAPADEARATPTPEAAQQAPQTPQEAAEMAAKAGQDLVKNLEEMTKNKTATAVDFEVLTALLPEPSGWVRSTPRGEQRSMGISMSRAEAEYERGDSTIKLEITDSSFNQLLLAPLSMFMMANYSERTSEGYKKAATINGQPGFETWENDSKDGEVTVVVANRFIVSGKGRNVENIDAVKSLVQAIDFSKLTAIK